jgi:hypothetical protein
VDVRRSQSDGSLLSERRPSTDSSFVRIMTEGWVTDGSINATPSSLDLTDPQALQLELVEASLLKSEELLGALESQRKLEMQVCLDLSVEVQEAAATAMELAWTRKVRGAMEVFEVANHMLDRVALLLQRCQ